MKIFLNSKTYETKANDINELKKECKFDGEIIILNGFAINSNEKLKQNSEIYLIKKGENLSDEKLKALMLSRNSPFINQKLQNTRICICGLGGLGSNVAVMLARVGVGELFLIDFDTVDPTNLNRQHYFVEHLWKNKTIALKEQLTQINPFVKVEILNERLNENNVKEILKNEKIICECFDNVPSKIMMINLASKFSDKKFICASGMAGYESSNLIKTIKFGSNVYICGDQVNGAKPGFGLMSPRVNICAAHQANMALRLILDENEI